MLFEIFVPFFGKNKNFQNHTHFIFLIRGTILWRALWGANIFLTRNQLPNPKFYFRKLALSFFQFFHNKLWWRVLFPNFQIIFIFSFGSLYPRRDPGWTITFVFFFYLFSCLIISTLYELIYFNIVELVSRMFIFLLNFLVK